MDNAEPEGIVRNNLLVGNRGEACFALLIAVYDLKYPSLVAAISSCRYIQTAIILPAIIMQTEICHTIQKRFLHLFTRLS